MIDTHCHLTDPRLSSQLDEVLARAQQAGVMRIVTIGTDPQDAIDAIELCRGRPFLRCAIGVHPNYCQNVELDAIDTLRRLQSDPSVVALGEMGLDYFHQFADRDRQKRFFEAQLQLALDVNKPIVIHSRNAIDDTLAILQHFPVKACVFHCFTGTPDEARRIIEQGYYLGFTGPVTYKKNDELRAIARDVPNDRIVVETDSPYLSPEPVRNQKTCEPAFVMHTARRIAEAKGLLLTEFDELTTRNAETLYGWRAV
ncbi:MAG: TatD family hydrolase [Tepidisphaeraceae bacterium]